MRLLTVLVRYMRMLLMKLNRLFHIMFETSIASLGNNELHSNEQPSWPGIEADS